MKTLFEEKQDFTMKFFWFLVSGLFFFSLFALVQQSVFHIPFGPNPAPDWVLLLITVGMLILVIILFTTRLKTWITDEGFHYRFVPFHFKDRTIKWTDIDKAYIRVYKPIGEYGGWGIRFSRRGKAFNVKGDIGLQLELKNGKLVLFGTQRPSEIEDTLIKYNLLKK